MVFHLSESHAVRQTVLKVKMYLNNFPRIKGFVSRLRFWIWKAQVHCRSFKTHPAFDIYRTCRANPADINYIYEDPHTTLAARKYSNRGKIVSGKWDKLDKRFEDTDIYKGFWTHFIEGKPWKETDLYKRVISEIELGDVVYGCNSRQSYDSKCRQIDEMFENIKCHGSRLQQSIAEEQNDPYKGEDEVSVCIGRDGDLLFEDGRHRLVIAKILDIESIPVKITMVHKAWHEFRVELVNYANSHSGKIYQKILHPDLASLPASYGEQRFAIIRQNLPIDKGVVLDIGAHWGYWSGRFEELGFECHAVESSVKNVYFMKKIRRALNMKFEIHCCSIFDFNVDKHYEIVLALSVFHHFLKDAGSLQKLKELLRGLDMDWMFFEPHIPGEPTMAGSYVDFDNEQFVNFIFENSCLSKANRIGQAEDGRVLYRLQR